ncbi:nitrilase [Prosthecomicrobium hirschii]|uniref:Nitrilase n=1 Tax=Prosthecodimorpha hirschii TaxID=665126 RepID=A0A0P6W9W0_9HYPH|nr:carbon-nitrogen hydrolase family protein [Prosthecomicrobium hirschii]KPL51206.1 nitrilase [Prosthecomicrobium hirschii]
MGTPFRLGAVGTGPADGNPASARHQAEAGIRQAAAAGAHLVLLPELFAWPYTAAEDPARFPLAGEAIDGPTARWASDLARDLGVAILYGAPLAGAAGAPPFNAALLARADGRIEIAATKIHLPPPGDGDAFGEADHFTPGAATVRVLEIGPIRVAPLICYDRRFPECWRAAAAGGADCVAVLVAGPAPADPAPLYLGELATHARANAVYALAAARFGAETVTGRAVLHDGATAAISPNGAVLAVADGPPSPQGSSAPDGRPGPIVLIDIDPAALAAARAANPTAARLRLPLKNAPQGEKPWQN